MDFNEYRLLMASQHGFGGPVVYLNGRSRSPMDIQETPLQNLGGMGLDLSLLGYTGPLGNSLSEVQKVLQIVDNTVYRQRMHGNPEEISKFRAYMKELGAQMEAQSDFHMMGQCSPTKSIIDYTLEKVSDAKNLINESKMQIDVKKQKYFDLICKEKSLDGQNQFLSFSCQYCKETFPGPIPLHQHERYLCRMNEEIKTVLQPAESSPASCRGLMANELSSIERATSPTNSLKKHMPVPNAYFSMNTEPNSEELLKISLAVGLPQEFVKEWFAKSNRQSHHMDTLRTKLSFPDHCGLDHSLSQSPVPLLAINLHGGVSNNNAAHRLTKANQFTTNTQTTGEKPLDPTDPLKNNIVSPLNLSSTSSKNSQPTSYTPNSLETHGDIPLDLSLPKHMAQERPGPNGFINGPNRELLGHQQESGPLELVNIKKEDLGLDGGRNSIHQLGKSTSPIFGNNPFAAGPVYTSLSPHRGFPPPTFINHSQTAIPGLTPYPGLDPIGFLPHMAYTYSAGATFAELHQRRKYQRKSSFQVKPKQIVSNVPVTLSRIGLNVTTESLSSGS